MIKYAKTCTMIAVMTALASPSWAGWWCDVKCTSQGVAWTLSCGSATLLTGGVTALVAVPAATATAVNGGNPVDRVVELGADVGDFAEACDNVIDQMIEECVEDCNE